ncbi:MAG TPA: alpha/beta hydrolase-fold protein [Anaerolineae bacterium]|nr:alpha/beta hydrolase-fold protein [Anaerolineae bacterium]
MRRDYHRWFSPSLGRDMEMLVFGHSGAKVLIFPTSKGRYFEWEDRGMMNLLGEHLYRGWLQVFCVDSVDAESWYARYKHPGARAWRQEQYDRYLLHEVMALGNQINRTPYWMTVGASFGAYHAANFGLRHPFHINRIIGMSGIYDIDRWTDGFYNEMVHAHNPAGFISYEHNHWRLEAMRRQDIIIVTGADDPLRDSSEYLAGQLWNKGVWPALRVWDGWAHDWPWWEKMLLLYINGPD